MARKKVVLLGSTGSIGVSTLKVAEGIPDSMELVALAAHSSVDALAEQAKQTGVKHVGLYDASKGDELREKLPEDVTIHLGAQGLLEIATLAEDLQRPRWRSTPCPLQPVSQFPATPEHQGE